jgi:hypothetical protein
MLNGEHYSSGIQISARKDMLANPQGQLYFGTGRTSERSPSKKKHLFCKILLPGSSKNHATLERDKCFWQVFIDCRVVGQFEQMIAVFKHKVPRSYSQALPENACSLTELGMMTFCKNPN